MHRLLLGVVVAAAICSGCRESESPVPGAATANEPPLSPLRTVEEILTARRSGDHRRIEALTVAEAANQVSTTLLAVDEFLAANTELCKTLHDQVDPGLSRTVDQSHLAASMGIFSRHVRLVDEWIDGGTANVSFVVDERLPARYATLRRIDGVWRYDPGPGYSAELPEAFRRMARGLRQVTEEVRSGRLRADEMRARPERLMEEVRVRLLPGVKMLPSGPGKDGG